MSKSRLSAGHTFLLGIMALMVAALCVTVKVVQENIEARVIMASIWVLIAVWWLVQSALAKRKESSAAPGDLE